MSGVGRYSYVPTPVVGSWWVSCLKGCSGERRESQVPSVVLLVMWTLLSGIDGPDVPVPPVSLTGVYGYGKG